MSDNNSQSLLGSYSKSDSKDKTEVFADIADSLAKLYKDKNTNYGDSFGKLYDELGPISALIPLTNKLDRLKFLLTHSEEANKFESVEDTLRDLASYAIMTLIEYKNHRERK